jgi:predicted transcriptional regulator
MPPRRKSNADLMREWRALLGINTAAAGERLAMSGRAIEDIEQGRRRADDELTRIALLSLIGAAKKVEIPR